jgi:hypothetical protein
MRTDRRRHLLGLARDEFDLDLYQFHNLPILYLKNIAKQIPAAPEAVCRQSAKAVLGASEIFRGIAVTLGIVSLAKNGLAVIPS